MQGITTMREYPSQSRSTAEMTRSKRAKSQRAALWVGFIAFVFILPLVIFSLATILFQVKQWNLPGVFIYDRAVGWLNPEETATLVDRDWNLNRQILLVPTKDPENALWLSSRDLGYWVDPTATAKKATAFARGAEPLSDILSAIKGQTRTILPVVLFDEQIARKSLENFAEDLTIPAVNASISYQDGAWVALPGRSGWTVDFDATLDHFTQDAFTNLLTGSATLYFKPLTPSISDLRPVLTDIESVLEQEFRLTAYDPISDEGFAWMVPLEIKRNWVTVDPETYTVRLSVKGSDVQDLVNSWEAELGEGRYLGALSNGEALMHTWEDGQAIHTIINHDPTTYQVNSGESLWSISLKLGMPMWHILEANPGLTTDNLTAGMSLKIPSLDILLPLPVVENKRIVIDLSDQQLITYENGQVRSSHIVSTGIPKSPTMAGIFQVQTHELNAYASNWDLYMPNFLGIYQAWPDFMNGIHGLPLLSNGRRLWASSLGSPASYGCIILDLEPAEDLYYWADPGVVVEINP